MPRVKKETTKKVAPRNDKMSVPVYSLAGRAAGEMSLPKEIFGAKVNEKLLSQALRVYMTNQKTFTGSTKTRGEVTGTTAKMYRQKGTGRARHGAQTAPIFVGGGIVFGPKPRKVTLDLPKKMKKAALRSALSEKQANGQVLGVVGLESSTGKTSQMAQLLGKLKVKSALIVTSEQSNSVYRAARNIQGIDVLPINLINALEVLRHEHLILDKGSIEKLNFNKGEQTKVVLDDLAEKAKSTLKARTKSVQ